MRLFKRKQKRYTNDTSTNLLVDIFNWAPTPLRFTDNFYTNRKKDYEYWVKRIKDLALDVFSKDLIDGEIGSDSTIERAHINRCLTDELSTAKSLNGKRLASTIFVLDEIDDVLVSLQIHKDKYEKAEAALDEYKSKR